MMVMIVVVDVTLTLHCSTFVVWLWFDVSLFLAVVERLGCSS